MATDITARLISDKAVTAVIFLNFAVIVALGFPTLSNDIAPYLRGIDYGCLVYFVVEAILKIYRFGWREYWSKALNRFDFIIVILAAPSLITVFMETEVSNIIIVLRAGRFLRILRALRFIPNADHLWRGVGRALRASVGVVLALSLYNIMLGLLACQFFQDIAPDLFRDPIASTYTIFQVFTIEGWHEVPAKIISHLPPDSNQVTFVRGFFVFVVVTGGLLGLSLTNAVLVDEMVMDNTDPVEKKIDALTTEIKKLQVDQQRLISMMEPNRGEASIEPADSELR